MFYPMVQMLLRYFDFASLNSFFCHSNSKHTTVSRAKSATSGQQPLSFEHKFNLDRQMMEHEEEWPEDDSTVDIENIGEPQLKRLQPLIWLELTTMFDRYSLPFQKRKPPKKKRKEGEQHRFDMTNFFLRIHGFI